MARDRSRLARRHTLPMGRPRRPLGPPPLAAVAVQGPGSVHETAGVAPFQIVLSGPLPGNATVTYGTVNGSALAGQDYTATSGTAPIPAGVTSVPIAVPITNDAQYRGNRYFSLVLSAAVMGATPLSIVVPSVLATILEDDDPPEGESPLNAGLHPRIYLVPDAHEGLAGGISVATLRTRLLTHYASNFNTTVGQVNGRLALDPATAAVEFLAWDAAYCALFALLDPATMPTIANFAGRTKAAYLAVSKAKLLAVGTRNYRVATGESPNSHPISVLGACAYDWAQAADPSVWTDADRQNLAESVIIGTRRRKWDDVSSTGLSETSQKILSRVTPVALALAGDAISGTSTDNGQPYTAEMTRIATRCKDDHDWMLGNGTFFHSGKAAWKEGTMYGGQAINSFAPTVAALSTAYGTNLFATVSWLREFPFFFIQSIIPVVYTGAVPRSAGVRYKYSSDYELPASIAQMALFSEYLRDVAPEQSQIVAWFRMNYNYGLPTGSTVATTDYFFGHYFAGARHLPQAAPSTLGFPLTGKHGLGHYFFRETNDFDPTSTVAFFSAMDHDLGGHQEQMYGTFSLWRAGHLLPCGIVHKNYSAFTAAGMRNNHGSTMDFGSFRILNTTAAPGDYGLNTAGNGARSGTLPADARAALVTWQAGEVLADDINSGAFDYVQYDQTRTWPIGRATYHLREFFFLRAVNGGRPYIVLWDRVTVVDPAIHLPFQNQKWVWRPTPQDGTEVLIDGPGVGDAANLDTEGDSGEYQSLDGTLWKMVHTADGADGVVWMKVLLPQAADVRIIGGDYNWCARDATPTGRLDSNREDGVDLGSTEDKTGIRTYMRNPVARWSGRWRTEVRTQAPGAAQQFLSVFAPGLASVHTTVPDMALVTGAAMQGAVILDPARTRVVLGPVAHTGVVVGAWSVTLPAGATTPAHLVAVGLPATTAYTVSRVGLTITATPGPGTTTSDAGVLEVTI